MRRLYAWGLVLWSIAWIFLPPQTDSRPHVFWWLALCGTVLMILAGARLPIATGRRPWRAVIAAAALAGFAWWWFDAIFIGPALLAAAVVVMVLAGHNRRLGRLGDGLLTAGTVAVFQLVGYYLFLVYLGPRGHGALIPTELLASALQLGGVNASALGDGLHLMATDRLFHVVPSLCNMGVFVFFQMFLALVAMAVCGKTTVRRIFGATAVIALFAFVRYLAVVLWDYSNGGMFGTYWEPVVLAWTAWPVAFFLQGRFAPVPQAAVKPSRRTPAPFSTRRLAVVIVAVTIGVVSWTAYESYHPAGVKKAGRMLIDEMHSDWEWSDRAFDTLWYGQQSTYNFYCLAEFWDKFFHVTRGYDTLTPGLLSNYDILVLKVPTRPYAPVEVDAVTDFVRNGGGLILIGEHTNVFGYATFLNPVAARFGQRFISDIAYDLLTGDLNLYHPPRLLPHPVVQNMPTMLWGGPCTVWGGLSARPICRAVSLKTLPADYTGRNFFPDRKEHTDFRYGMFFLALSTRCGKGRIVSFTDSTIWSNFFVFLPGKVELALALADYVNRREWFPYWRILAFVVAVGALGVGAIAASGLRREGFIWMAAVGFLAFGVSARLIESINRRNYPLPEPHTAFPQLNFEGEHSRFFLPEHRLARQEDKDFSTFYLWTQRVGIVPRKFPTLETALAQPGAQILIDPVKPFDQSELDALRSFVQQGGTLYVFDDPGNSHSSAAPLLKQFGMSFDMRPIVDSGSYDNDVTSVLWRSGGRVVGGEALLTAPAGAVVCARKTVGRGQVIAYANSHVFERKTMGYTAMIPNPVQNAISRFEYRLMTYLDCPRRRPEGGL